LRNKLSELRQLPAVTTSLSLAGVSEAERTLFTEDLKSYLDKLPDIATKADLDALKNQNLLTAGQYTTAVDTQLETQVQNEVSTARAKYIETQKKTTTSRSETSLIVPGRIGILPKSFPVRSEPFERSNKGTTLCSRTAWKNGQNFGINLPRGDAYVAKDLAPISSAFQKKTTQVDKLKADFAALADGTNFADIYTTSKSQYGHRAVAFLNQTDKKRYVLDPYTSHNYKKTNAPMLLSDYQKQRQIIQANFYKSEYYVA
jgi:hypothetical protein